jgi:hypothetical protein
MRIRPEGGGLMFMREKNFIKSLSQVFLFIFIFLTAGFTQPIGSYLSGELAPNDNAIDFPYYGEIYGPDYNSMDNYTPLTYDAPARYIYGHIDGGYRGTGGYIHFGRRFDNSNNFSSGISSYQGTSTGPGPNGGYPGTPRGIYPTRYFDTSIYPNTYIQVQSR